MELLVVIAITTIILGLLFGPLIQGLNLSRRAQAVGSAQSASRFALETMTRELSQASFVYDNSRAPIFFPIGDKGAAGNFGRQALLFAKIDFVPAATRTGEGPTDPTTGGPLGGAQLVFPNAPGRRVVRYWLGLLRNTRLNDGGVVAETYRNVYEFPRTDGGTYNPFVLWRAEFDPSDPNLVKPNVAENEPGGFNDPNFFYNTEAAPNGRTYAENWRTGTAQQTVNERTVQSSIVSPVLSVDRVDLLAWNRGSDRSISATRPFRTLVSFSPSTVVGDSAVPGHLSDANVEQPSTPPTAYTAKYGQWTMPYTLTFYRHASRYSATSSNPNNFFGSLSIRVGPEEIPNGNGQTRVMVRVLNSQGSLVTTQTVDEANKQWQNTADFTASFSQRNGSLFVKTARLAFVVDPLRGRVLTALPPLATRASVPVFYPANDPRAGEPIPMVLRRNTLHPLAGQPVPPPSQPGEMYRRNHGISELSLVDEPYYVTNDPAEYPSPLREFGFGPAGSPVAFGSALVVTNSERVLGPDNNPYNQNLVPYTRGSLNKQDATPDTAANLFLGFPAGELTYRMETDLNPDTAKIEFADSSVGSPAQGLPATIPGGDDQRTDPQDTPKTVEVTYLWQNNYARNERGDAVDANGSVEIPIEGDIVKVDYSTRSVLNVAVGVRVFDVNSGRPQTIQLSNKVKINNVGR